MNVFTRGATQSLHKMCQLIQLPLQTKNPSLSGYRPRFTQDTLGNQIQWLEPGGIKHHSIRCIPIQMIPKKHLQILRFQSTSQDKI